MRATIGAVMLMAGAPVSAQGPAPETACAVPLVAPAPWAGWSGPSPLVAADTPGAGRFAMLVPGRAATVTVAPVGEVAFVVPPARPAAPISYGGMLTLAVPVAATYRVAIGAPAWIDVAVGGRSIASVAHDHGPPCSGIVKTVDFMLPAGTATIELSGAPTPVIAVMAVRVS